jgi:hypothetical protein
LRTGNNQFLAGPLSLLELCSPSFVRIENLQPTRSEITTFLRDRIGAQTLGKYVENMDKAREATHPIIDTVLHESESELGFLWPEGPTERRIGKICV